jgi:O-antigen/teichoic acid export membrane protein
VPPDTAFAAAGRQVRGSMVLLAGRVLSLGVNLLINVLIVRALSKSDYGAFSYALAVASVGSTVALLGLDKAVTVFVPMFIERREYQKVYGTVLTVLGITLSIALVTMALFLGARHWIGVWWQVDPQALALTTIVIAMVPVQVLDAMVRSLFAILGDPRAIFLRTYILAPFLRLAAVLALFLTTADVYFLAVGYVVASVAGLVICVLVLIKMVSPNTIVRQERPVAGTLLVRQLFAFAAPLVVSELRLVAGPAAAVLLLEHFWGTAEVANFRAILPLATLNMIVFESFKHLFPPMAARLVAREDHRGLDELYCQTAVWIAIMSFPIFIVTCAFSQTLITLAYGERYAHAAPLLSLMAGGYYVSAALGFNGVTLRMFGRARYMVAVDLIGSVGGLILSAALIPAFGALGAAISVAGTLVVLNVLYQHGLHKAIAIRLAEWRWLRAYVTLGGGAVLSFLIQRAMASHPYVAVVFASSVCLIALRMSVTSLPIAHTFPELLRNRWVRVIVGQPAAAATP